MYSLKVVKVDSVEQNGTFTIAKFSAMFLNSSNPFEIKCEVRGFVADKIVPYLKSNQFLVSTGKMEVSKEAVTKDVVITDTELLNALYGAGLFDKRELFKKYPLMKDGWHIKQQIEMTVPKLIIESVQPAGLDFDAENYQSNFDDSESVDVEDIKAEKSPYVFNSKTGSFENQKGNKAGSFSSSKDSKSDYKSYFKSASSQSQDSNNTSGRRKPMKRTNVKA